MLNSCYNTFLLTKNVFSHTGTRLLEEPLLKEIAEKHGKTPAQVWVMGKLSE